MLAYSDCGNGKAIVLLHGFCENKDIWQSIENALKNQCRIICIDFPGFGDSEIYINNFTMESLADEVARVLHHLNISACIMIGHSMGGYVTLAFAEKYPELLAAFGLFQSTALADSEQRKINRDKTLLFIEKFGLQQFADSFVQQLFYPKNRSHLSNEIHLIKQMTVNSRMEAIVGCTLAMRNRLNRTHILKNTSTPILWVQGKEDQTLPMDNFYAQVEMCKQPITHILEETGHVAMIERPFETVKIIESFLNHCYGKHSSSL